MKKIISVFILLLTINLNSQSKEEQKAYNEYVELIDKVNIHIKNKELEILPVFDNFFSKNGITVFSASSGERSCLQI